MSRIGKKPIEVPKEVKVDISKERIIISGPKGKLERKLSDKVKIELVEGKVVITPKAPGGEGRAFHGLFRALIANMVEGVTKGFEKNLELSGVGYRGALEGKKLKLQLGYSHPVEIVPPEGVGFSLEGATKIKISGIDKELVSKVASEIRRARLPEPYKGKGIKYAGETIRRKAGKAAKAVAGPA